MSNVTVQEALKAAIEALTSNNDFKKKIDALEQCKSALSEIEKCEPVAECLICATGNDLPEGEYCRACGRENNMTNLGRAIKYARGGNSVPTKPLLFTSPQPSEWVGLPNAFLQCFTTIEQKIIKRTELELKQLNTKG